MQRLRSDNGGEFTSTKLAEYFREKGIVHGTSAPYNPQQNGIAERSNRILIEKPRYLLHGSEVSVRFWADVVNKAAYLRNGTPTAILQWRTQFSIIHSLISYPYCKCYTLHTLCTSVLISLVPR